MLHELFGPTGCSTVELSKVVRSELRTGIHPPEKFTLPKHCLPQGYPRTLSRGSTMNRPPQGHRDTHNPRALVVGIQRSWHCTDSDSDSDPAKSLSTVTLWVDAIRTSPCFSKTIVLFWLDVWNVIENSQEFLAVSASGPLPEPLPSRKVVGKSGREHLFHRHVASFGNGPCLSGRSMLILMRFDFVVRSRDIHLLTLRICSSASKRFRQQDRDASLAQP